MKTRFETNTIHLLDEQLPPTVLTIFGATGDLSMNYLLPTLVRMDSEGLLPDNFHLVAVGRRDLDEKSFLKLFQEKSASKIKPEVLRNFARHLIYFKGNFDDQKSFGDLRTVLADKQLGRGKHECYNRLYYFATAPDYFAPITRILKHEGLLIGCAEHERTIRVLVEKPFGTDLRSAKALNKELLRFFSEDQIYRIDHYLGKETVQNLLVARFANDFLEPIWNRNFIDHIEISVLEDVGAGSRSAFYGGLRDIIQNHILQILALLTMEQPKDLTPRSIRNEKVKILQRLVAFSSKTLPGQVVRGQYDTYVQELGRPSTLETYVALKAFVNNPRWKGVPFYLRTGKRLPHKIAEVSVHFKKTKTLFGTDRAANVVTFRIQPDESVQLQINNKLPGAGIRLHTGKLDFGYKTAFLTEIPSAYERLLLDFIQGDQRLFIRSDEIEAAWKFTDSIVKNWNNKNAPVFKYRSGSYGPKAADTLMSHDDRQWWTA